MMTTCRTSGTTGKSKKNHPLFLREQGLLLLEVGSFLRNGKLFPEDEGIIKGRRILPDGSGILLLFGLVEEADTAGEIHQIIFAAGILVKGILVVNTPSNPARQAPIDVALSEDGKTWEDVFADETSRAEYRIDFGRKGRRAKYVRVRRRPGLREEPFHLSKILVYGDKLY
jgi:hypothetical protein